MNKEIIKDAREALDNLDDYARMANIVATGPLLAVSRCIDLLDEALNRISVLEDAISTKEQKAEYVK